MTISRERKEEYFTRMEQMLDTYTKFLVVGADNVGSHQFQNIRAALRGKGEVLMGKNTMMRKVVTLYLEKNPGHPIEQLLLELKGNVGLIFIENDINEVRNIVDECVVPAPARSGAIAPVDVIVPAGPTGCDPGQTAWFQALNVPTKISRGQIEIVSDMRLFSKGDKVGNSEAALLQKLNINPFVYGLSIKTVYDNGSLFAAAVLDLTDDDLKMKFSSAMQWVAKLSLAVGYPTLPALPHMFQNTFKKLVAIAVATEYRFKQAEGYTKFLDMDPEELAKLAAEQAAAAGGEDGGDGAAAEAAPEEEEEEADVGAGGLFGGDEDGY